MPKNEIPGKEHMQDTCKNGPKEQPGCQFNRDGPDMGEVSHDFPKFNIWIGVLECWSVGVMGFKVSVPSCFAVPATQEKSEVGLINSATGAILFTQYSIIPILQYSNFKNTLTFSYFVTILCL
jgi:hypothetical protein